VPFTYTTFSAGAVAEEFASSENQVHPGVTSSAIKAREAKNVRLKSFINKKIKLKKIKTGEF
jgi:hypothetical protein